MADEEYRWLKKGDDPFLVKAAEPDSPTWAALHWLVSSKIDDSFLAEAFKEAGDKIVEELARADIFQHVDKFFMPIAYLYRHSLELKMKQVVRLGIHLELIPDDKKASETLAGHNLHQLWNLTKATVQAHWSDSSKNDIERAERIILEFHRIDRTGQKLRYSKDHSGRSTLDGLPKAVQLTHVRDVFEAVFNFLNGCGLGLEDAVETRNEMLSYHGGD